MEVKDCMEVKSYEWVARYPSIRVEFPYSISICYGGNGHNTPEDRDFAEVLASPQCIEIRGNLSKNLSELSEEEFLNLGVESRFIIFPLKGCARQQKRSLARLVIRDKLRIALQTLKTKGLIKY